MEQEKKELEKKLKEMKQKISNEREEKVYDNLKKREYPKLL